jgi:ABC-type sugar transport system substrate-binding protein
MAETRRVALFLTREDEAQRMWAETVREESRRHGFALAQHWNDVSVEQNHAISDCVFHDTADAFLILPASVSGPAALLAQAASKGKAVILLDRLTHDLDPATSWSLPRIRQDHPGVLAVRVSPDEVAIGRVQGRQVLALLPKGGTVLYVQGNMMTAGAVHRTAGFEEVLAGQPGYKVGKVDGGWTSPRAEAGLHAWLSLVLIDVSYCPDLVVSQSEVMVEGIRRALARSGREFSRPELERLPITACDGMPAFKRAVDEHRLAATIEIPSRTAAAMQVLGDFWTRGTPPTELELLLPPDSYPSLKDLARRAL